MKLCSFLELLAEFNEKFRTGNEDNLYKEGRNCF